MKYLKSLLILIVTVSTHTQAVNLNTAGAMIKLSPQYVSAILEPQELATDKARNFETFRKELLIYQRDYDYGGDPDADYDCSLNHIIREKLIANIAFAEQLNDYYEQNYLYETLLKTFVNEAIKYKCKN